MDIQNRFLISYKEEISNNFQEYYYVDTEDEAKDLAYDEYYGSEEILIDCIYRESDECFCVDITCYDDSYDSILIWAKDENEAIDEFYKLYPKADIENIEDQGPDVRKFMDELEKSGQLVFDI
jgi:hypothetical protein